MKKDIGYFLLGIFYVALLYYGTLFTRGQFIGFFIGKFSNINYVDDFMASPPAVYNMVLLAYSILSFFVLYARNLSAANKNV